MSKASKNNSIRTEIKNELNNAIANRIEKGTIVTSNGEMITFTVKYGNLVKNAITVKGTTVYSVDFAAAQIMYELGYTQYARGR
jgi:hypothetical protein